MTQYLLSIYQPDGPAPEPEVLEPILRELDALNEEIRAAGAWVFAAGLQPPETATVLQAKGDELQVETEDEALEWSRRLARVLSPLHVEVRPFG